MPQFTIDIGGEIFAVRIEGSTVTAVNGKPARATLTAEPDTHRFCLTVDGTTYRFSAVKNGDRYEVAGSGTTFDLSVRGEHAQMLMGLAHATEGGSTTDLRAPMPALVRAVNVKEGDAVTPGQTLVVLEAMKMENDVRASRSARVGSIGVSVGMTVEKDQVLLTLE